MTHLLHEKKSWFLLIYQEGDCLKLSQSTPDFNDFWKSGTLGIVEGEIYVDYKFVPPLHNIRGTKVKLRYLLQEISCIMETLPFKVEHTQKARDMELAQNMNIRQGII